MLTVENNIVNHMQDEAEQEQSESSCTANRAVCTLSRQTELGCTGQKHGSNNCEAEEEGLAMRLASNGQASSSGSMTQVCPRHYSDMALQHV